MSSMTTSEGFHSRSRCCCSPMHFAVYVSYLYNEQSHLNDIHVVAMSLSPVQWYNVECTYVGIGDFF